MATRLTTAEPSLVSGQAATLALAKDLIQVGEAAALHQSIQNDLRGEGLPSQTCYKVLDLAAKITQLVGQIEVFRRENGFDDPASIDDAAQKIFMTQFEFFERQVCNLKHNCRPTFAHVQRLAGPEIEKALPVFEKQVAQYLQTRNSKDLDQAKTFSAEVSIMNHTAQVITYCQATLDGSENVGLSPASCRFSVLESRLGGWPYLNKKCETVMQRLDSLAAEGLDGASLDHVWNLLKRDDIDQTIDRLHEKVGSDQVNYWVWHLLGKKAGENYGLVHRYDDLGVLKEAILRTTQFLADKIMEGLDKEVVLAKLFKMIGEPQVENPMEWMKQNACYYTDELNVIASEMRWCPSRRIYPLDSNSLNRGFTHLSVNPFYTGNGFKNFKSSPEEFVSEKHRYTQILEKLEGLGQQTITDDLKEQVEEMIEELSNKGLANTINYEIWRLGGEQPGDNWGIAHRYDNPAVLKQALMIALQRDLHERVVAANFDTEEGCDAFYAEIAQIAFGKASIPSGVDPVAYGKEHIAMHQHQITLAMLAVKEMQQCEKNGGESAMGAAIPLSPAEQSMGDHRALTEGPVPEGQQYIQILEKLQELGQQSIPSDLKGQIEAMIAHLSERGLADTINYEIWRLGGEKSGDDWGVVHRYDDTDVLRQALTIALQRNTP
ncbi:MAG: hypothetical protein AB7H48_06425 [Parachlamydiales bacterium]